MLYFRAVLAGLFGMGALSSLAGDPQLRISEWTATCSEVCLKVELPVGFMHRLDILASTNLAGGDWVYLATGLEGGGLASVTWLHPAPSGAQACFYLVGDHDLDTDLDGLSDAGEMLVHHTDPLQSDSDRDGLSDGDEIRRGTNPLDPASRLAVLYADSDAGSDSNDGWAPVPAGGHGPKRSMAAALAAACSGDQIVMGGTAGFAEPMPGLGGKSVRLYPEGSITWRP